MFLVNIYGVPTTHRSGSTINVKDVPGISIDVMVPLPSSITPLDGIKEKVFRHYTAYSRCNGQYSSYIQSTTNFKVNKSKNR